VRRHLVYAPDRHPSTASGGDGRAPSSDMPGVFFAWDTTVHRVRSALTRSKFEGACRGEPMPMRSPRLWAGMCGGAVARLAHRLSGIAHPGPLPCYAERTQALEYDRIDYGGLPVMFCILQQMNHAFRRCPIGPAPSQGLV
jgi:hypothetical protein